MKNLTIMKGLGIIGLMVFAYISANAQAPITVDTRSLYEIGFNSGGASGFEATDSVTNGGTTYYYVMPDANVNPTFNPATDLFANLTSTNFAWSITGVPTGNITAVATHPTAPHYRQIAWTGVGLGTVRAVETSIDGCLGSPTSIPVQVINAPSITGVSFSIISCPTGTVPYTLAGPTATLTITSDVVVGHRDVEVTYSLNGPGGFADIGSTLATVNEGTTIDLTGVNLSDPGTYTLRIISITDRISRKSGVTTTLNNDYTFVVNRAPVTGPIYHIPNM